MKTHDQWINWKLVQKPVRAKPDKVPINPATGNAHNPLDPAIHQTFEDAMAKALELGPGYGIGFVLTEKDEYFCIDLDKCITIDEAGTTDEAGNFVVSDFAMEIYKRFPGIFTELSYSKNGLHFFGTYKELLPHKNKFEDCLELYTKDRFIAFTEENSTGDYNKDFTDELSALICDYLPASEEMPTREGKREFGGYLEAIPEYNGPEDDDELIRRMLKSNSTIAKLNNRATIQDLWNNNESVLANTYPSSTGDVYDRSSADFAFFVLLAFWAGRNGPRMLRMAMKSGLVRKKWDKRNGYLTMRTIPKACAINEKKEVEDGKPNCYQDPRQIKQIETKQTDTKQTVPKTKSLGYSDFEHQIEHFKGCVYIKGGTIFTPKHGVLEKVDFDANYGGYVFQFDVKPSKGKTPSTSSAYTAFTQSRVIVWPKVSGINFRPDLKPGEIILNGEISTVNTYIPHKSVPTYGNKHLIILQLIAIMIPNNRDRAIFISYLRAMVKYPGAKFRWAYVLQGVEGNGKTILANIMSKILGEHYVHIGQSGDIDNKFNGWLKDKLLIVFEEAHVKNKWETMEILKPMITNDRIPCQAKGKETVTIDNRANFLFLTNHKDALIKTITDRRYCVQYCAQQHVDDLKRDGLDDGFFKTFIDILKDEGITDFHGYLLNSEDDTEFCPVTSCFRSPMTTSTESAIEYSRDSAERAILDAIEEGEYGFRKGWISSWAVNELLKKLEIKSPPNHRYKIFQNLGYIRAPWSKKGQASCKISQEGNVRPVLYVSESKQYYTPSPEGFTADYSKDQSYRTTDFKPGENHGAHLRKR